MKNALTVAATLLSLAAIVLSAPGFNNGHWATPTVYIATLSLLVLLGALALEWFE